MYKTGLGTIILLYELPTSMEIPVRLPKIGFIYTSEMCTVKDLI